MRKLAGDLNAAIVVGGSVAGMLAARVLARYFDRVTVIERDPPARLNEFRRGAPQARHAHMLLLRGQHAVDRFFSDARRLLLQAGGCTINPGLDVRSHHFGVWKARYRSPLEGVMASRPLLEWALAEQLRKLPNITLLSGWSVNRFECRYGRIIGVAATARAGAPETILNADLIVDATGRGSQTPARLPELGFGRPRESTIKVDLNYATRLYRAPSIARDWKMMHVNSQPPHKRAGLILPLENGRWMVTLSGMHGDQPPDDEHKFLAFAKSLPAPDLFEAIQDAEPLTEITRFGFPHAQRRHYESQRRFPDGLLVIGDALCSFNPMYGQGMSVAAMHAEALNQVLHDCIADGRSTQSLWRRFFPQAAAITAVPWQLASIEDFRYAQTQGPRSPSLRFQQWYMQQAHIAAGHDPHLAERLCGITNLLRKPASIMTPDIIGRLLRKRSALPQTVKPSRLSGSVRTR